MERSELPPAARVLLAGIVQVVWLATYHRIPILGPADLEPSASLGVDAAKLLTPAGLAVFSDTLLRDAHDLFLDNPTSLPSCNGGVGLPAFCSEACVGEVVDLHMSQVANADEVSTWVTPAAVEAAEFWDPPLTLDPGADHSNVSLAAQRALSPAYTAEGPAVTTRTLILLSENDSHYEPESHMLYVDKLTEMGVTSISAPNISADETGTPCIHGEYVEPSRGACGYDALTSELAAAFED